MIDLFVFCGEMSGDLHGEKILSQLLEQNPHLNIAGVAGPRMRTLDLLCLIPMESFQVMGFVDVFMAFPRLLKLFYQVKRTILKQNPKVVLCIDYPEFSLKLAKALKRAGFKGKILHFISPTVWAWRKKRIETVASSLDRLFVIFPFEVNFYREQGCETKVEFVGHPLIERFPSIPSRTSSEPVQKIALFPGSRKKEILRNFPIQLQVIRRLLQKYPSLEIHVSVSHPRFSSLIESALHRYNLKAQCQLFDHKNCYATMSTCDLAIAKSGTVTLELALLAVPTIVTYGISFLDLMIAKHLFKIDLPHYCIVNIIAQKRVFPELFGPFFNEAALFDTASRLIENSALRDSMRQDCHAVRALLGEKKVSVEMAQILQKELLSKFSNTGIGS